MKTKIVYVITSNEKDLYLEQVYISMFSVKFYMPDAHITLLTDKQTEATLTGVRKEELKYVDELVIVQLPDTYSSTRRSRILKTSVRKYIKGDFLFIDSDTIITQPLYDIDNEQADIAACWDTHSLFSENPFRKMCVIHGKILKWPIEQEKIYFNSGVIYVKDNALTHEFYELWNKNLNENFDKVHMDQPAFAKTNYMLGHVVQTLHDTWNCELKYGIKYLRDAKIVHYLCTNKSANKDLQFFILNDYNALAEVKKNAVISDRIINTIKDPFEGLATVSLSLAGKDVLFWDCEPTRILRAFYDKKFIFGIFKFLSHIYIKFARIKRFACKLSRKANPCIRFRLPVQHKGKQMLKGGG